MKCHKLVNGEFVEAEDPIPDEGDGHAAAIEAAGYQSQISTAMENWVGAEVTVYVRDATPRYYIDLMGSSEGIAAVVADDFPALIRTLKELHPLLALIGMDHVATARIADDIERDHKSRR